MSEAETLGARLRACSDRAHAEFELLDGLAGEATGMEEDIARQTETIRNGWTRITLLETDLATRDGELAEMTSARDLALTQGKRAVSLWEGCKANLDEEKLAHGATKVDLVACAANLKTAGAALNKANADHAAEMVREELEQAECTKSLVRAQDALADTKDTLARVDEARAVMVMELIACEEALAECRGQKPPEPEPLRIIPAGPMAWEFRSTPDGYSEWLREHGYTGVKFQTLGYHNDPERGRGFPCIVTLGPSKDPDSLVKDRLSRRLADPQNLGIHLWDEKPWTDKTRFWADYIREHYPHVPIFHGPFPWTKLYPPDHFDYCDHIISFQNCTRKTRTSWDGVYHPAQAAYYGKRMVFSVNPLDSDTPAVLADGERYAKALEVMATRSAGAIVWSTDVLWRVDTDPDFIVQNRGELPRILEAIGNVEAWQAAAPERKAVEVQFSDLLLGPWQIEEESRSVDATLARARCRAVAMAGYAPVASVEWNAFDPLFEASPEYLSILRKMADWDHWTPEIEAHVLEYEQTVLADAVRKHVEG